MEEVVDVYDKVGSMRAVESMDVTHIAWACPPFSHARSCTGKEGFPTLAYRATVGHSIRVRRVMKGFVRAKAVKTILRYDETVMSLLEGNLFIQAEFWLHRKDAREQKEIRSYLVVDGGYLWASGAMLLGSKG